MRIDQRTEWDLWQVRSAASRASTPPTRVFGICLLQCVVSSRSNASGPRLKWSMVRRVMYSVCLRSFGCHGALSHDV